MHLAQQAAAVAKVAVGVLAAKAVTVQVGDVPRLHLVVIKAQPLPRSWALPLLLPHLPQKNTPQSQQPCQVEKKGKSSAIHILQCAMINATH